MTEERKEPKLRFIDFAGDWKKHKVGDILKERNIQHPQNEEFPLVSFTVENGVTPKTERYEREQLVKGDKTAKKYKETRLDDIVYNPANLKFGAIARNKYGNAVFSPIYITYEVVKELALPEFIEMYVTRDSFIQNALQFQQGTVYERMAVGTKDFESLDIIVPSIDEQRTIGVFLDRLNQLINLYQNKLGKIETLRRAMLQKMFPKEGESVPEIRFPEFNDEWNRRSMKEIFIERNERGDDTLQILSVSIHSGVSGSELDEETLGKHIKRSEDKSTYKHVYRGDLVFNMMRAWQGAVGAVKEEGMISPAYISAKPTIDMDVSFLDNMVKRRQFIEQVNTLSYGVTDFRKRLYWDSFVKVDCAIPCIEEQIKIGKFFNSLDALEDELLNKYNELKKLKKGLQQQMFA